MLSPKFNPSTFFLSFLSIFITSYISCLWQEHLKILSAVLKYRIYYYPFLPPVSQKGHSKPSLQCQVGKIARR
jgi:hypothetical protein